MFTCLSSVYYQKITTGDAVDDSWNISENSKVQKTLALIINSCIRAQSTDSGSRVPEYIRTLFQHYCSNQREPSFNEIDQIQHKMTVKLQKHLFIKIIRKNEGISPNVDGEQRISHEKVFLLFPKAVTYINDQGEQVLMTQLFAAGRQFPSPTNDFWD